MYHKKITIILFISLFVVVSRVGLTTALMAAPVTPINVKNDVDGKWLSHDKSEGVKVHLYFFWSDTCPHCQRARPFVASLAEKLPWLSVHSLPLRDNKENVNRYIEMATALGEDASSVPAFLFCGQMEVGFDDEVTTGNFLAKELEKCYQAAINDQQNDEVIDPVKAPKTKSFNIPLLSDSDIQSLSLPVLTVILAGMDSFNPCAFFVLLALLSLLVHARSRARMFAIGGIFVFFSGFIYFLFMAAWLNIFLVIGQLSWVTLAAGMLALALALINIKDYFWFGHGVSLSIPDSAKPRLFQRMRGLLQAENWTAMIVGTVTLAITANSYELLCTAGFPMAFTRVLTLHELSPMAYYLYLLLYNIVYVIPLFIIVLLFTFTLGTRKLSEKEGRALKLLAGIMMAELGMVLIIVPEAISQASTAAGLLGCAVLVTYLIVRFHRANGSIPA